MVLYTKSKFLPRISIAIAIQFLKIYGKMSPLMEEKLL